MENLRKCQGKSLPRSSQGQAQVVSMFFKAGAILSKSKIRMSKNAYTLNSARISSSLGNYVSIRRTRHSGRAPLRGARSGIQ